MSEALKPCPFCGSELVNYSRGVIGAPVVFFKCGNIQCGAVVSFDNDKCRILPELAIKQWDERHDFSIHAHWLLYDDYDTNAWECSACHDVWQLNDGTPEENHMNFCQNCGAKMDANEADDMKEGEA